jgi:hypothetical protein
VYSFSKSKQKTLSIYFPIVEIPPIRSIFLVEIFIDWNLLRGLGILRVSNSIAFVLILNLSIVSRVPSSFEYPPKTKI